MRGVCRELCVDVETTGLSVDDRIVEIGAVELLNYLPTGKQFHVYVNPEKHVGFSETIHKLSDLFLREQPLFCEIARDLLDFIQDDPLIAHNASFDRRMLDAEFERLGLPGLPNDWTDTITLAKAFRDPRKRGRSGLSLDALCTRFKVDTAERKREGHGALRDAHILSKVYLSLRGGAQMGLDVTTSVVVPVEPERPVYVGRAIGARLTDDDQARHCEFLNTIKNPVWRGYQWPEGGLS